MKRFVKGVCLILAMVLAFSVPVFAAIEEEASTRASAYFIEYETYLFRISSTKFEIWFDVTACGIMSKLGTSEIELQRSSDGDDWETIQTYTPETDPQMLCDNTASHGGCVTYSNASSAYQYRAQVTFYAKNGSGFAERYMCAEFLY